MQSRTAVSGKLDSYQDIFITVAETTTTYTSMFFQIDFLVLSLHFFY